MTICGQQLSRPSRTSGNVAATTAGKRRGCAPFGDQRICLGLDIRQSISWLSAVSMNAVEMR